MQTRKVLQDHLEALQAIKVKRREAAEPMKVAREALVQKQMALQQEIDVHSQKIAEALGPDFAQISKEIGATARALGAVSMTEAK